MTQDWPGTALSPQEAAQYPGAPVDNAAKSAAPIVGVDPTQGDARNQPHGYIDFTGISPDDQAVNPVRTSPYIPSTSNHAGADYVPVFGDESVSQKRGAPHLSLAPEQENEIMSILATAPRNPNAAAQARAKFREYLPNHADNFDQVAANIRKGHVVSGWSYGRAPLPQTTAMGSLLKGAGHSSTLGADNKALSFIDAISKATGTNDGQSQDYGSFWNNYNAALDRTEGYDDAAQQQHPYYYTGGELAGAFALPTGIGSAAERAALDAGRMALRSGATGQEARVIANMAARRAVAVRGAQEGAGYGAASGVLSADNPSDAITGGISGGAFGGALGGLGGAVASRFARPTVGAVARNAVPSSSDIMAAATRQGLEDSILPADVGGPFVRGMTAATAQTPLGVIPIANAASHLDEAGESRLSQIAGDLGTAAADREGVGVAATEGAQNYARIAKRAGGRLYDTAGDKAAGATVDLPQTREVLDQQIARLQAVPGGGAGLSDLQRVRADLDKPLGVQAIRDMRTDMAVSPEFRNTPAEGKMKLVVNAASKELEAGLRAQGLDDAADAYRAADDHWRSTLVNLERNIEPIIGKISNLKSPEAVSNSLNSAMRNNGARVGKFISSLPDEQQGVVRASMLNPLGRNTDGQFSISRFATDWNKLSPAAKRAVFGPEAAAALNDLATVGGGAKAAMKYANHSNTARALIAERTTGTLLTGASGLAGLKTFGATLIAPYITGRLLASPRFARTLAKYSNGKMTAPGFAERLTRIARAEPYIANDIFGVQQHLRNALSTAPQSAAAKQSGNNTVVGNGHAGEVNPEDYGVSNDDFPEYPQADFQAPQQGVEEMPIDMGDQNTEWAPQ